MAVQVITTSGLVWGYLKLLTTTEVIVEIAEVDIIFNRQTGKLIGAAPGFPSLMEISAQELLKIERWYFSRQLN